MFENSDEVGIIEYNIYMWANKNMRTETCRISIGVYQVFDQ